MLRARYVNALLAAFIVAAIATLQAAIPVSDDFNRPNGTLGSQITRASTTTLASSTGLLTSGATAYTNWTAAGSYDGSGHADLLAISSNVVVPSVQDRLVCAYWSTGVDVFSGDQKAQITTTSVGSGNGVDVGVRMSGDFNSGTFTGYTFEANGLGETQLLRWVNNNPTSIQTFPSETFVGGEVARLEAMGSTLSVYKNGTLVGSKLDSTISTGQPGGCVFDASGSLPASSFDNFSADNITGGGGGSSSTSRRFFFGIGDL